MNFKTIGPMSVEANRIKITSKHDAKKRRKAIEALRFEEEEANRIKDWHLPPEFYDNLAALSQSFGDIHDSLLKPSLNPRVSLFREYAEKRTFTECQVCSEAGGRWVIEDFGRAYYWLCTKCEPESWWEILKVSSGEDPSRKIMDLIEENKRLKTKISDFPRLLTQQLTWAVFREDTEVKKLALVVADAGNSLSQMGGAWDAVFRAMWKREKDLRQKATRKAGALMDLLEVWLDKETTE